MLAAVMWVFSTQVTGSLNNLSTIQSITWFPWVGYAGMMINKQKWAVLGFSILVTVMFLGGYPQHVILAIVMILSTGRLKMACANLGVILAKCTNRRTVFSEFGSTKSFGASSQLLPYGVPLSAGTLIILCAHMFGWWGI